METIKTINQNSVEINKNSKGYTFSIKVYADTENEMMTKLDSLIGLVRKKINNMEIHEELK